MSAHASIPPALPGPRRGLRWRLRGSATADRTLHIGVALVGFVLLASLIGQLVLPDPSQQDLAATLEAPSASHPFGTDELGRDVLSRTLAATWLDLAFGVGVTLVSLSIGVVVGTTAGFVGGWVERAIMRVVDAAIAFPFLVFVLAVIAIVGPGVKGLAVGIIGVSWAVYARLARGEMLVLREKQFIQAAQTLGYSRRRVVLRHATPNLLRPVTVFAMSDVVTNILTIAALSFLGLGVPPPTPEWGRIIADGQDFLLSAWWISTLPGLVVVIVGLGFVLIGDALGERLGVRHEGRTVR